MFKKIIAKALREAFEEYAKELSEQKTPTVRTLEGEIRQANTANLWFPNPMFPMGFHPATFPSATVVGDVYAEVDDMIFAGKMTLEIPTPPDSSFNPKNITGMWVVLRKGFLMSLTACFADDTYETYNTANFSFEQ